MERLLIAHDLGTSGNKAVLYSENGSIVRSVTEPYPLLSYNGNCAEQNASDWWNAVCVSTKKLLCGIDEKRVAGVSFSGQMMGCLIIDRNGEPLRTSMIWADMRSSAQEAYVRGKISERDFYRITGNRISSSYSVFKLMWIRDNQPELYGQAYKMLNAKDYIIYRLTGKAVTDKTDASGTAVFDINTMKWSDELIDICGIRGDILPDVLESTAVAGYITPDAARLTGLAVGTPVVTGAGDGICAAVGTGINRKGIANCCLGTSSWISTASDKPVCDPDMITFNFANAIPDYVFACGTMQCGGGSLSWAVKTFCADFEGEFPEDKPKVYDKMCAAAEKSPVGANGLIFLPYLMGERSPRWNDNARGAFVGLTMSHTKGDIFRAVMEGVALNLTLILNAYRKAGLDIESLILIGGGARCGIFRRILADAFGIPVICPEALAEATSTGAAIIAGVGTGIFPDFSVADRFLGKVSKTEPEPEAHKYYEQRLGAFDAVYNALVPVFNLK